MGCFNSALEGAGCEFSSIVYDLDQYSRVARCGRGARSFVLRLRRGRTRPRWPTIIILETSFTQIVTMGAEHNPNNVNKTIQAVSRGWAQ
ncbi:hypothetical protein O3G_MSEX003979 [Manduca sexta]|uniref:Uncharacterized protein n=1 Tax=Manduca sexta TaxID=7130 RepID=A0A921YTD6_MANSE|nr:hypothetical protein O3G_MSEX003979 [Manduca sexta]